MGRSPLASLDAIAHFAESNPQSPALIEADGTTLSYKELWAQIEMLSCRLEEAGIDAGEKVAVLLAAGEQDILAVAGVLNRHIAVPLQPKTTLTDVKATLIALAVTALIVGPDYKEEAETALGLGITVLVARTKESPDHWQIRIPASPLNPEKSSSNFVIYHFTSATTGGSKIVPLTADNLNGRLPLVCNCAKVTASDRYLLMIPQGFGYAVLYAHAHFSVGAAIITTSGFDPASYVSWLNNLRPTWYTFPPAVHQAALERLRSEPPSQPVSLRLIDSTFASLPKELKRELEQILGVRLYVTYGATEAGAVSSEILSDGDHVPGRVGRTCGLEIGIMSASGMLLESPEEGEIAVRGDGVATCYLNEPEATRTAFQDGWYRTGDVGRLDADGNLFLTGRVKEMINRGGEKVFPGEVDGVLESHPAVLEAATFAVPHPTLGEDVACAVVLRASTEFPLGIGELRRFVAQKLVRYKVPSRIYFIDQIPRGEVGKPQRGALTERFGSKRGTPPSPTEMTEVASDVVFYRIYEIWARILDRDDLGFDENFFDAGGDSLAAINMLAEVDRRFGSLTSASAASFLDEPTLAHLVELVGQAPLPRPGQNDSSDIRVFPVRDEGTAQRLFCVPADGDEGLYFRRLAAHLRGHMDLLMIRPANTWFSQSLFTFENAGATTAKLIRQQQPEGPYLVGGYCFGGIVAIEAARQLTREGQDVRLVLFDVYRPGFPTPLRGWRAWLESARCQWRARGEADNENFALDPRYVGKRLAWLAVTPVRKSLVAVENASIVKWFLRRAQKGNLPFYAANPIEAPILHFLSTNQPNVVDRASRFGWREMARKGIEEQYTAFDHVNVFHESNLAKIVDTLLRWSSS